MAALFIFSAYAKFCPWPCKGIFIFESKYLGALGIEGYKAQVFSKVLIGVELAIGILLLLPYYIKKYIIPLTMTILGLFSVHLILQIMDGASGNCGCFGECFTMTPIQALVKNIISILLLIVPLKWKELVEEKANLNPVIITFLSCILLIFILMQRCCGAGNGSNQYEGQIESNEDINVGKKLLLYLDPTCDDCIEMLKECVRLKKQHPDIIPDMKIIFGGKEWEETEGLIQEMFKQVGQSFDHEVLTNQEWSDVFFKDYMTPGLKFLDNGKQKLFFEGEGENAFNANKLLKELRRN